MDIIDELDTIISNKSENSLYVSDSENSTETISFQCYNKKGNKETHTFQINEWENYIKNVDSLHHLECLHCNRIIQKNEYVRNGTFIYKVGNKIIERTNYVNGLLDGLYERFYINGLHYEKTHYKNGIYHGPSEFWYDITGKKMKEMHFENGILHGPYKYWNQNGKLIEDFYYNHGIRSDIIISTLSKNSKSKLNNNDDLISENIVDSYKNDKLDMENI